MALLNKSLDSILSRLTKTLTDLEDFTVVTKAQADNKKDVADRLLNEVQELDSDIARANVVAFNIKKLLAMTED